MNLDLLLSTSNHNLSVSKDPIIVALRKDICNATKFLDIIDDIKIGFRVYCIKNNITSIPKCICGNYCKPRPDDNNKGFAKYCSIKCNQSTSKLADDVLEKLSSYDWMYEQRITNRYSKEHIAELLNVSVSPVVKWIKKLNIPDIKYNESLSETKIKLQDKDWLYNQHVVERKTVNDISEMIQSSPSTVSVYLDKHQIQANESNSYPRKHVRISKGHQEVIDYIRSIYSGNILINDREILNGQELDIVIPEFNLAIEYNGVFRHLWRPHEDTEAKRKGRYYHLSKTQACLDNNIQLIHIWSSQWKSKRDIIKSIISTKLNMINNVVYARKCTVKEISTSDKNTFLDYNHLQGRDRSSVKLGLYESDMLLAVMTFTPARFNKKYQWELSRFAIKQSYSIPGAFSKLLSWFRKNNSGSIISYADKMYSQGNVYSKNGFNLIQDNPPSYWYVKRGSEVLEYRSKYTKKAIAAIGDTRTEAEIMDANGYDKIWDCGTLTFVKL